MKYDINDIKKIAVPIAKEYGVGKLALFGSYARSEQNDASDVDFLIEKGKIQDLFMLGGFINALEDSLGLNVDVLTYDALKNSLISDVIKDEIVLYEN